MPEGTPIFNSTKDISISWNMYWKSMGDTLMTASSVKRSSTNTNLKYVLNGNQCTCNYYNTTPPTSAFELTLPFPSALPFKVNDDIYMANTSKITLPGNTQFVQFMYIIAFDING